MFKKILIANRGEIACRIIRTAHKLGVQSVAIYSNVDQLALHVKAADSAYCVGEASALSSYLNIEAIIAIAKKAKVEAIHPGYGFLSENGHFAQACEDAGFVFIGPPVEALNIMASKQRAKQLLENTSVPLLPGYHGVDQDDAQLLVEAKKIGFPVLLKAAYGGGGRGMRTVFNESQFIQALASARREALTSFADDTMLIEKLIVQPRHVEMQIMADNYDHIVHLFERDCSIQRRHQKIIEEAPASFLSPELRARLAQAAIEVARRIHYRGAGTVEFLLDETGNFYFMEMNTRLQVEHPVTEMITGLDLVAWQLNIAANEPLPLMQQDITAQGHAIECRIYAEDPHEEFIPAVGKITLLNEPQGEGIRIDSGIELQTSISKYYDPLIAKLIVWGENRQQALHRLQHALASYVIGGVKTNLLFLQAICAHAQFASGHFSTDFLTQEKIDLQAVKPEITLCMAASYDYFHLRKRWSDPVYQESFNWQMHLSGFWYWQYHIQDEIEEVKIVPLSQTAFQLQIKDITYCLHVDFADNHLQVNDEEQIHRAQVEEREEQLIFYFSNGVGVTVRRFTWQNTGTLSTAKNDSLLAPMPATVVAVLKNKGDKVKEGDNLVILEAMKMEHTIRAPRDGVLSELFYEVGAQVMEGAELLVLTD